MSSRPPVAARPSQIDYVEHLAEIVDTDVDPAALTEPEAAQVIHRLTEQTGLIGAV